MDREIKVSELPTIDQVSPTWLAIESFAKAEVRRLRLKRDDPDAELRKLDLALGSVLAWEMLLALPATIKKAKEDDAREKVSYDFGISPPAGY